MEELQARHRKEQRDLQNRITQKKKQANKKSRKGVNDECDRLEADLKEQQQAEVAALHGEAGNNNTVQEFTENTESLSLNDEDRDGSPTNVSEQQEGITANDVNGVDGTTNSESHEQTQPRKPNRQKARLARRAAEQEELAEQAAVEAKNMPDKKQQERTRMLDSMKQQGLQEKEIRADGHCLYSAVADQLQQLNIPLAVTLEDNTPSYKIVRAAAADYIDKHQDDFAPFLEEPLPKYLHKVRDTGEWGGQLELMALAKSYGTDINVLQDFGRVEKIESGGSSNDRTMWLGYYKHGFGLGEHYNSLRKAP